MLTKPFESAGGDAAKDGARLAALAQGAPVVLLVLSQHQLTVSIGSNDGAADASIHLLDFGLSVPAGDLLRHDPPTAAELERAIEHIENALMPLARRIPPGSTLFVDAPALAGLWNANGASPGQAGRLSLDAVEAAFQNLAAVAEGGPAASRGVPPGVDYALQLLVLREAMHHWGFSEVAKEVFAERATAPS